MRQQLFFLAIFLMTSVSASLSLATERPPQFVMLAFDNCKENQTWRQVSTFLDEVNAVQNSKVRFTFFLSAAGLLADRQKNSYIDPLGRAGKSMIGFGGDDLSVLERVGWVNRLHDQGNEIASHAVGHFPAGNWTVQQWRDEFAQYEYILTNLVSIHGWTGDKAKKGRLNFAIKDLQGFRAPYLEGGKNLNQVLMENNFRYDTSDTSQGWEPTTWPRKYPGAINSEGLWNFGLGFITLPLTVISEDEQKQGMDRQTKSTKIPTMDYNFCFKQTGGCPEKDPYADQADRDAAQMEQGYLNYFLANYNGNRAPLNIGHHFEQHRGGAYNRALLRFAKKVCGLPEVRCTTYSELTDFMNRNTTEARRDYQNGNFPKGKVVRAEDLRNL